MAVMVGEPYSSYTDTTMTYDYLDFVSSWFMPPNIYDVMPLLHAGSSRGMSQPVGSAHSPGGASISAATTTLEVLLQLAPPSYNIRWPDGGSMSMLHRPNAMDSEVLGLTEDVLQPEVYLFISLTFVFLISSFASHWLICYFLFFLQQVWVSATWLGIVCFWNSSHPRLDPSSIFLGVVCFVWGGVWIR